MPSFRTRLLWVLYAIITVLLIVLVSNGFYSDLWIPVAANSLEEQDESHDGESENRSATGSETENLENEENLSYVAFASIFGLEIRDSGSETKIDNEAEAIDDPNALNMELALPEQSDELMYGSSAEVLRFTLSSKGPCTIRYMGFDVEFSGLKKEELSARNWKLYMVKNGQIDYENPVGKGESFFDGKLKLRLSNGRGKAFILEPGTTEFVLKTYVLRDRTSENDAFMKLKPTDRDWSFVPGRFTDAWMTVEEKYGEEFIRGLPSKTIVKS